MKEILIEKAADTPGRPEVENVTISIQRTGVFEDMQKACVPTVGICVSDAADLHDALRASLPQSTFNRLAGLMLRTCSGEMIRAYEPEKKET